ncbi:hypothetical protein DSECCO2_560780 [anaerobic digester metagenome]
MLIICADGPVIDAGDVGCNLLFIQGIGSADQHLNCQRQLINNIFIDQCIQNYTWIGRFLLLRPASLLFGGFIVRQQLPIEVPDSTAVDDLVCSMHRSIIKQHPAGFSLVEEYRDNLTLRHHCRAVLLDYFLQCSRQGEC